MSCECARSGRRLGEGVADHTLDTAEENSLRMISGFSGAPSYITTTGGFTEAAEIAVTNLLGRLSSGGGFAGAWLLEPAPPPTDRSFADTR